MTDEPPVPRSPTPARPAGGPRVDDVGVTAALDRLAVLAARLLDAPRAFALLDGGDRAQRNAGPHSLNAPILDDRGRVVGSICVICEHGRDWTDRDRTTLSVLADAAASEAARLEALGAPGGARGSEADAEEVHAALNQERTARDHAELLRRAAVALSRHNDVGSVLEALAAAAVPALGSWCTIHLPDTGLGSVEATAAGDRPSGGREAALVEAAVHRSLRSGRELLVALPDGPRAQEALVLPLVTRERTLAVMVLAGADGHSPLRAGGGDVARALTSQAVLALDNAILHDAQAIIAATLTQALLPRALPRLEGIALSARYRAAGRADEVGGDFYDVFTRGEDGVAAFVVGDVVGKGAGAAALTSVVRHTLRAAFLHGDDPGAAVELANRALADIVEGSEFCTAVYGQLEHRPGGARVRLVRAGHLPPTLVRADGGVEVLEPAGGLLGPLGTTEAEVLELQLGPGDALVLVTDGVTELGDRGGTEGTDALLELLGSLAGRPAQTIAEAVERQALLLSDGALRDDIAVLVVQVEGQGAGSR